LVVQKARERLGPQLIDDRPAPARQPVSNDLQTLARRLGVEGSCFQHLFESLIPNIGFHAALCRDGVTGRLLIHRQLVAPVIRFLDYQLNHAAMATNDGRVYAL
jgi:hypothetical protein